MERKQTAPIPKWRANLFDAGLVTITAGAFCGFSFSMSGT